MARDFHQQHNSIRRFKGETVFEWTSEPADERSSSFVEPTRYGPLWDRLAASAAPGLEVRRPRPPRKRGSRLALWLALVLVVMIAVFVFFGITRVMKARQAVTAPARPASAV